MTDYKNKLINLLKENNVIKFGKFTLSSGRESDYYVDMKKAISKKPMLMIRKAKKTYGTSKQIEGELLENDDVVIVEDVTTTGGSLLKAINVIEDNGGNIVKAFVIVDREEGAQETFKENNIEFTPLLTISEFKKYL